jgi:hypothetical protein
MNCEAANIYSKIDSPQTIKNKMYVPGVGK